MEYIALALAPGIAICVFIFYKDIYNREPRLNLVLSFILGCLAILPALFFELTFKNTLDGTVAGVAIFSYGVVAFSEEFSKFLGLRLYAYNRPSFDEPLDGIVYGVMVSMGFATLENVLYVTNYAQVGRGLEVGIQRMFLSVPAHATFGVVMGYFVGKAKFDRSKSFWLSLTGLLGAVFFHGTYDFFLFLKSYSFVGRHLSEWLLAGGAIASFIVSLVLSRKLIRYHQLISKQMFTDKTMKPELTIRKAGPPDIPLIRQLAFNVWPQTYAGIISAPQIDYMLEMMYSEKSLHQQMTEGAAFVVAYEKNEPVGFASYQETEPGIFKLHKLYVLPSQQGKGTGRFIINYISDAIRSKKARALQLQVNRRNKARDFYEKLGFTVIREIDLDIGNGYVMDDYVMEKKI